MFFIRLFEENMLYLSPMKRKIKGFFIVVLGGVLALNGFGVVNFVFADDLKNKQEDLEDLQKKQETYQKIVNLKATQETLLNSQINSLEKQTTTLEGNIEENIVKLETTTQRIDRLAKQIEEKEATISEQKEVLADFVRAYYEWNADKMQRTIFAHGGENPFSLEDQSNQFQEKVSDAVEKIESVKRSLGRDRDVLHRDKTELETLNAKLEQQTVYLESAKKQKETLATKTVQEKEQYQSKLSKVEEQIRDIEREIESLEAGKSDNIDFSKLPSKNGASMGYPVKSVRITQNYGKTTFTRWYSFHNGTDFGVSIGTEVMAAANGKILATGDSGRYAYGKWMVIDHGNGLVTLYGHLSKQKISKGKSVKKGDVIGLSGNTGYSTGPHLHFSVFTSSSFDVVSSTSVSGVKIPTGAHLNPMKYLP